MQNTQKSLKSHQLTANWSSVKCANLEARSLHASVQYKHYLITIGGQAGDRILNDIIWFDMIKLEWKQIYPSGANPAFLRGHTACIYEDQILIYGGRENYGVSKKVYRISINPLNLLTTWENIEPSDGNNGPARIFHTAHIYKKAMHVLGGADSSTVNYYTIRMSNNNDRITNNIKKIWFFSLETLTWGHYETTGDIPADRNRHCSVLHGNKLYLYGGSKENGALLNDFYALDLDTRKWECLNLLGPTPSPRYGATIQESNGKIIIFGGCIEEEEEEGSDDDIDFSNELFMFETKSNAWIQLKAGGEVHPECECSTSGLFQDTLFVLGGSGYQNGVSGIHSISLNEVFNGKQIANVVKSKQGNPALKKLFTEKLYTDVTFQVEDQEFSAHRNVLAGSCKYFHNMFTSGMQESKAAKIDILDVKAPVFKALLEFIYCEQTEVDQPLLLELIHLSDKYCFPELKTGCEESLAASLNEENFVELAKLSEQLETVILKEAILKFMAENTQKILQRKDLGSLPKPILVQVMSKLSKKT